MRKVILTMKEQKKYEEVKMCCRPADQSIS